MKPVGGGCELSEVSVVFKAVWRCPRCGMLFVVVLELEDILDGCREGETLCPNCVDELCRGLTRESIQHSLGGWSG